MPLVNSHVWIVSSINTFSISHEHLLNPLQCGESQMTRNATQKMVALPGARSIREAAQTHADITAALREAGDVRLDCTDVSQADVSFIQIILAGHLSAKANGQVLALSAAPEGALLGALQRGGFAQAGSTDPGAWIGGGGP